MRFAKMRVVLAEDLDRYTGGWDYLSDLVSLYEDRPRLVSYSTILAVGGLPVAGCGIWVSASGDFDGVSSPSENIFEVARTGRRCLRTGSEQIDSETWAASPARAVLDIAEDMPHPSSCEFLMKTLYCDWVQPLDWAEVPPLAEALGYNLGLRRLCSVAAALADMGELWNGGEALLEDRYVPADGEEWEMLAERKNCPRSETWQDSRYKIQWKDTPEDIFDILRH